MSTATSPRLTARPDTANEQLADALIRHQVFLMRHARQLSSEAAEILNEDEDRIVEIIAAGYSPTSRARLARLLPRVIDLRTDAWRRVRVLLRADLQALATQEREFLIEATERAMPVELDLEAPAVSGLAGGLIAGGRDLRDHVRDAQRADASAISATLFLAQNQAQTAREAARSVVGRQRANGRDGILQRARNNLEAIARTMVTGVTSEVRQRLWGTNKDIVQREVYTAVLDGRTTPICRSLDGSVFGLAEGYFPPIHMNCRSIRVPLIDGEVVGQRNSIPIVQRRLLREYAAQNGIRPIPRTRDQLPRGQKGNFDQFRAARARELIGSQPLDGVTYATWLARQPVQFQDDVLGVTRAKLWRRGDLTLDRFVDESGRQFTLKELAQRDADAFREAGLDPERFR